MDAINGEMTVREARQFCSPVEQADLARWADWFGIQLREFHLGHIRTYQADRLREADRDTVNGEVGTLLRLLESIGVGDASLKAYRPLQDPDELSVEEREALPERAKRYIEKLEDEVNSLSSENGRISNRLRKANWARRNSRY
jgi:hypothetical protein